ncbi:MAG: beta-galactosidase [Kiritimatiellae bacterium]|nr:beta-galactosidase [Kiritimatiellia bacterium]
MKNTCLAMVLMVAALALGDGAEKSFSKFGTSYYPEDRTREQWVADVRLMKELGIDMVRVGEFNWSGFEPREGEFDFSQYHDFLDLLLQNGMKAMMCTPCAAIPQWMACNHPATVKVRVDIPVNPNGNRHTACASSPEYRAFCRRIAERMAEAFKDRPEVVEWQLENEPMIRASTGECVCEECKKGFRRWLRRRYGTIDELNRAWHTSFWSATFDDWNQISPPFRLFDNRQHWQRDYSEYHSETTISLLFEQRDILRRVNPKWKITCNCPMVADELRHDVLFKGLDFTSSDVYVLSDSQHASLSDHRWRWNAFRTLGVSPRPFTVAELGPMRADVRSPRSYDAVRTRVWDLVAHGADGLLWFCMNTSVAGEELSTRLLPWSGKPRRAFAAAKRIKAEFDALPVPVATAPVERSRVAVVFDAAAYMYFSSVAGDYGRHIGWTNHRLSDACERFGIVPDVLAFDDLEAGAPPYEVLFLPPCEHWTEGQIAALKRYVGGGGVVAAVTRQNILTDSATYREEPYPAGMLDLYGLEINDTRLLRGPDSNFAHVPLEFPFGPFVAETWMESLEPSTAETLVRYSSTCFAGDPLMTVNRYGKGRAYYLACGADADGIKSFAKKVLSDCGIPVDREWPWCVTRARRGACTIVANHSDSPVVVPAEKGRLLVGAPRAVAGGIEIEPMGVAVFAGEVSDGR